MPQERPNYVGPSMRAATRSEKFADMLRSLYESMAEQPLGQIADAAGISDLKGMLAGFSDPSGIKSGVMPDGPANLAGIPFAAYKALGKLPYGKVFHGTGRVFDKFEDVKNESGNILGGMRHFAEDPVVSNQYANQFARPFPDNPKTVRPNNIPVELEAKNTLDLVEPNIDDLSTLLGNFDSYEKAKFIREFKLNKKHDIPNSGDATKHLAYAMSDPPLEVFNKTPFDAIRYSIDFPPARGGKQNAWATPDNTPVKSAISGMSLSGVPKKIQVIKSDKSSEGSLLNSKRNVTPLTEFKKESIKLPKGVTKKHELIALLHHGKINDVEYDEMIKLLPKSKPSEY